MDAKPISSAIWASAIAFFVAVPAGALFAQQCSIVYESTSACRGWSPIPPVVPPPRFGSTLTFDTARGRSVLFGGSGDQYFNDTWEWDGATWDNRSGPGPQPRLWHATVYDNLRNVAVLFGGWSGDMGRFGDTWERSGTQWIHRTDSGPPPRSSHAMAFDSTRGITVLFGGFSAPTTFGDTWEWEGSAWTLRSTSGPSPRQNHVMTYDQVRNVTVMFGGTNPPETWEWDGSTWTQRNIGGGPANGRLMTFDSARGVTVLVRNFTNAGQYLSETWEWDGVTWTLRQTTGVGPGDVDTITFDTARGVLVAYGSGVGLADAWELDGTQWTLQSREPAARSGQAMAYDSARATTVMFGGSSQDDTWEWDGSRWSLRASAGPSPRRDHAMAFDEGRGVTVLFGGRSGTFQNDTWEWDGANWTRVSLAGPSPRAEHAMAYDESRGVVVLLGGLHYDNGSPTFEVYGDTWEWNGSSWLLSSLSGPGPRAGHRLVYDPHRGITVMYGGFNGNCEGGICCEHPDEVWDWDGSTWTKRCVGGPLWRNSQAMAYDRDRGVTVLFSGTECDTSINDTWELNGASWIERRVIGPPPRWNPSMVFDRARHRMVMFGGDSYGTGDVWEYGCRCAEPTAATAAEAYAPCPGTCYATKNRYLSFIPPVTPCGASSTALRVTLGPMPGPSNCPRVGDFSAFNGTQMWVGDKVLANGVTPTGVYRLQPTPSFRQWSPANGVLQVADCNIVPCATYTIEAISDTDYPVGPYSAPLVLTTTPLWGDIVSNTGGPADGVVNGLDITAMVQRFRDLPGVVPRPWCDLYGNQPTQGVNLNINALDIVLAIDAFRGHDYPFPGPTAPNPCPP